MSILTSRKNPASTIFPCNSLKCFLLNNVDANIAAIMPLAPIARIENRGGVESGLGYSMLGVALASLDSGPSSIAFTAVT